MAKRKKNQETNKQSGFSILRNQLRSVQEKLNTSHKPSEAYYRFLVETESQIKNEMYEYAQRAANDSF